ncbi:hypothetical protein YC2023_006108 [Brassica napus]
MGDEYSHPISGASCRSLRFVWLSSRRQREIGTVTDSIQSVEQYSTTEGVYQMPESFSL